MGAIAYRFTADDDRVTSEVNEIIRKHPQIFEETGRAIDRQYSVEAVQERLLPPLSEDKLAMMRRTARETRDRKRLRELYPPHRRDLARPQRRFTYVVRDFFERLHPPIPSPGLDWATDKLLRYWLVTHEATDQEGAPQLTEFQMMPWRTTLDVLGRDVMQWRDRTGSEWPDALSSVRRALGIVRASGLEKDHAHISKSALEIIEQALVEEAELESKVALSQKLLPVLRAAARCRHFPSELQGWAHGENWPTWTHRFDWKGYSEKWVKQTWIPLIDALHPLSASGFRVDDLIDLPCDTAHRELIRREFRVVYEEKGSESSVARAITSLGAVLTLKVRNPGYLNWEEHHRYFEAMEYAILQAMNRVPPHGTPTAAEHEPEVLRVPHAEILDGDHQQAPAAHEESPLFMFAQDGQVWRISFEDVSRTLPNRAGFRRIQMLLERPHEPVLVEVLLGRSISSGSDDVQDRQARREVEERIELLREVLASDCPADLRIEAEEELEALEGRFRLDSDVRGQSRRLGDERKRAANASGKSMLDAIALLEKEGHARLAAHLRDSIIDPTGVSPVYRPAQSTPWVLFLRQK